MLTVRRSSTLNESPHSVFTKNATGRHYHYSHLKKLRHRVVTCYGPRQAGSAPDPGILGVKKRTDDRDSRQFLGRFYLRVPQQWEGGGPEPTG